MNGTETQLPLSKRLLTALFAVVLVVGLVPVSAWADNEEEQNSNNETPEQTDGTDVAGGGETTDNADQSGTEPEDQAGNAASLLNEDSDSEVASIDVGINPAGASYSNPYYYDGTMGNAAMRNLLEAVFPDYKDGYYRLDGSWRLVFNPYSNPGTFSPKNTPVCSYNVEWKPRVTSDYSQAGTLTLCVKTNVGDLQSVIFNGEEQKLAPTVTGLDGYPLELGKDYTLSYETSSGNYVDAGSKITVTVDFIGDYADNTYYPNVERQYTINKAPVTVDVKGKSETKTYNGQEQSFGGFEVTDVRGDAAKLYNAEKNVALAEGVQAKGTDANTYSMNLDGQKSFINKDDNFDVTFNVVEDGSLIIKPADVTVSVKGSSLTTTYNGEEQSVKGFDVTKVDGDAWTYFKKDLVELVDPDSACAKGTNAKAEPYTMGLTKDSFKNGDANFNVTFDVTDGYLKIDPATAKVAAKQASKTYGQPDPEKFEAEVAGTYGEDTLAYTVSRPGAGEDEDADTYTGAIVATGETEQGNYVVEYAPADFTINQAEVTVSVAGKTDTLVYNGQEQTLSGFKMTGVEGESKELYSPESIELEEGAAVAKGTNVDTYKMGLDADSFTNTDDNFKVTFDVTDGVLTIGKRAIEVSDSASFVYNGKEQALNISAGKVTGLVDGDRLYLNNAQVKGTSVGTYTDVTEYTWDVVNNKDNVTGNYDLKVSGQLTITAADGGNGSGSAADNGNAGSSDKANGSSAAKTGDSTAPFAAGAAIAAAAALAALFVSRKLRRNGTR